MKYRILFALVFLMSISIIPSAYALKYKCVSDAGDLTFVTDNRGIIITEAHIVFARDLKYIITNTTGSIALIRVGEVFTNRYLGITSIFSPKRGLFQLTYYPEDRDRVWDTFSCNQI